MVDVDLDKISTVGELFTHGFPNAVDPVGNLRPLGNVYVRRVSVRRISTRDAERAGRALHSRSNDDPIVDSVAKRHVSISATFGFNIANRREPGQQWLSRRHPGPNG